MMSFNSWMLIPMGIVQPQCLPAFKTRTENGACVAGGKGHDMGMSLYGANVLAKKQLSAATILSYYYPGTKILD